MKNLRAKPFAYFFFGLFATCFVALAYATGTPVADIQGALKNILQDDSGHTHPMARFHGICMAMGCVSRLVGSFPGP